jgi:hypothetical protein
MIDPSEPGFYGADDDLYYVSPAGRSWQVANSDGDLSTPRESPGLPSRLEFWPELMTSDGAEDYIRRVERVETAAV